MKTLKRLLIIGSSVVMTLASAVAMSWGMRGSEGDTVTTLSVKSDGTCVFVTDTKQPRKTLEMQVRSWDGIRRMQEGVDEDDSEDEGTTGLAFKMDQKPFSDEELVAKIRALSATDASSFGEGMSPFGDEIEQKVETVEVSSNSVRIVTSRTFSSLIDLASENVGGWGPNFAMLEFENARFEIDASKQLRLTLNPSKDLQRYGKMMLRGLKSTKAKMTWKIVMPGKISSSGLPQKDETATWIEIDSTNKEGLEAAIKLFGSPLVIASEAGNISLPSPMESKQMMTGRRRTSAAVPDLPITDAGAGFVAEASGLTVSTVYVFPEGKKLTKTQTYGNMEDGQQEGTVVQAKLFPPKGRTIRSVSGAKVLKAADNLGRPVPAMTNETEAIDVGYAEVMAEMEDMPGMGRGKNAGAARFQLQLNLPTADAQSIDEIEAEAIVLTIGGWKEMTITNLQANATNAIDLGEILAGAKLYVTKVAARKQRTTIRARLEGPADVNQLDLKVLQSGEMGRSSTTSGRTSNTGGKTTRQVTIESYDFGRGNTEKGVLPPLIVRLPQDLKRERVKFKLTALDLL